MTRHHDPIAPRLVERAAEVYSRVSYVRWREGYAVLIDGACRAVVEPAETFSGALRWHAETTGARPHDEANGRTREGAILALIVSRGGRL